jgi:hypothetical protein
MTLNLPRLTPHPSVRAFMVRNGIPDEQVRNDGRLTLRMDGKARVHIHSLAPAWMALTTDLFSLRALASNREVDEALESLMNIQAGMLQQHPSALVIEDKRGILMLQQIVPSDADGGAVEQALAELMNVLPFWQAACAQVLGSRAF